MWLKKLARSCQRSREDNARAETVIDTREPLVIRCIIENYVRGFFGYLKLTITRLKFE